MLVAKISPQKSEELQGVFYSPGCLYGPKLDGNGSWFISLVEAQFLQLGDFEVIEYVPPISNDEE